MSGVAETGVEEMRRHRSPSSPKERFYRAYGVVKRVNYALVLLASAVIIAINLFTLWEVFTRYVLRSPAAWAVPLTGYLLLYVIFIASSFTLQQGGHVRVEFAVELLPQRLRQRVERSAHVLGLAFILVLLWQATRMTQRAIAVGERDITTLAVPLAMTTIAMPIGLMLMTITYIFIIIDAFLTPAAEEAPEGVGEVIE